MTTYSYSPDEENFYGDYATAEEARINGLNNEPDSDSIYIGENIKHTAHDFISAENLLEELMEEAANECGESAEDWLDALIRNKSKCAELTKIIGDWLEINAPVKFWSVKNIIEHKREL